MLNSIMKNITNDNIIPCLEIIEKLFSRNLIFGTTTLKSEKIFQLHNNGINHWSSSP